MPDLAQLLVLISVGACVAFFVALPFIRREPEQPLANDRGETAVLRRQSAYEALRDLAADYAAGSLTEDQYREQRAEAETRAARVLEELEGASAGASKSHPAAAPSDAGPRVLRRGRRLAAATAAILSAVLLVGFVVPGAPLANRTVVNEALAAALAAEEERQAEIERLLRRLATDRDDAAAFSALADAYLAGSTRDDLINAALVLLALIELEPDNESAYVRLIGAYLRVDDYENAAAATESLAEVAPDSPDLAFFRGVIALRHEGDRDEAVAAFDEFLERAPNDPRAGMVRSLRAEAAGELPEER